MRRARGLLVCRGTGVLSLHDGAGSAGWSRTGACCGQPCATLLAGGGTGACVLLRDVPVTCRAWGSVSRFGPIDVCRAEPSISLRPAPGRGRLVSFASEAWLQPHETSRERAASRIRALLRKKPSPNIEGVAQRQRRSKRRVTAGRSARLQGLPQTGPVAPFHHRGLPARPLRAACSLTP